MNCFFILLLYFFVRARCDSVFQNGPDILMNFEENQPVQEGVKTDILASVRQYPSQLHKCTATFIALDALLTTAKCLYCEDCQLLVHAFSSTLTDDTHYPKGVSYIVQKTVIHPDYERAPEQNNVGLIQLATKIPRATVFPLQARVPDISGLIVETYRWHFTTNYREFNLERVIEQTISNAACSAFFEKFIDYKHVCTRRKESILLGPFDQGVPVIDRTTGVGTIIGIYEAEGKIHSSKVETYQAIFPFVAWIKRILACNFTCISVNETTPVPYSIPTFPPTRPTFSHSTEIPPNDNSTAPTFPKASEVTGPGEVEEGEPEKKPPNAATGGDSSQKGGKPFWNMEFPFSEQKQAPVKPKALPGKRFT